MRHFFLILSLMLGVLLLDTAQSQAQRGGRGGGGGGGHSSGGGGARSGGAMRPANVGHASPAVGSYGGGGYRASRPVIGPSTYRAPAVHYRPSVVPAAGRAFAPIAGNRTLAVTPRYSAAFGPQGTTRAMNVPGGVAIGPYGGHTAGAVRTGNGTYYTSGDRLRNSGEFVRNGFRYNDAFRSGWFGGYPGSWFLTGWNGGEYWNNLGYSDLAAFGGYPTSPNYYDYGSNVVSDGPNIFINGDSAGTMAQYADQATDLAEAGTTAAAPTDPSQWTALGVFAMVNDGETKSSNIFELALNKQGIIRGNYYNALTDTNEPVHGSVDKKTQRAAWTVGNRKTPVYEAGIANLTKDETTMLVHYGKDKSQQYALVRVPAPADTK